MARRSDHSREELYALALDAAREIVRDGGLRALTVRAVAKRIGYSVGTIYNLFNDLDDLVVHLEAEILDALYDAVTPPPSDAEPQRALFELARRYLAFTRGDERLWNLLFEHSRTDGSALPDWYHARIDKLMGVIEATFGTMFGPDETAERARAARVLWAGVHGIGTLAATGKLANLTSDGVDAMIADLISNYVRGVGASREAVPAAPGSPRARG